MGRGAAGRVGSAKAGWEPAPKGQPHWVGRRGGVGKRRGRGPEGGRGEAALGEGGLKLEGGRGGGTLGGGRGGLGVLSCVCGFGTLISCQRNLEGQAGLQPSPGARSRVERAELRHPPAPPPTSSPTPGKGACVTAQAPPPLPLFTPAGPFCVPISSFRPWIRGSKS